MAQEEGPKRGQKHVYTDEFRRSVVDRLLTSGKTAAQVAKEFGISAGSEQLIFIPVLTSDLTRGKPRNEVARKLQSAVPGSDLSRLRMPCHPQIRPLASSHSPNVQPINPAVSETIGGTRRDQISAPA